MSRRRARWKRPVSKPVVTVPMPITVVVPQDVDLMKKVAEDVVLVMNGLEAQNNTGAF